MSLVMFRRALADLRWTVFWYALGLAVYAVLIMSFYPTVRENAQMTQQLMEAFPKAMMDAFGAADMASLSGFVGGKFLNVMWPIIVGVFVIMAGAATVAREVERGTIELLLSVPESRTRLLLAKLAALLVGILALVAVTVGALALGAGGRDAGCRRAGGARRGANLSRGGRRGIYGLALLLRQRARQASGDLGRDHAGILPGVGGLWIERGLGVAEVRLDLYRLRPTAGARERRGRTCAPGRADRHRSSLHRRCADHMRTSRRYFVGFARRMDRQSEVQLVL